MNRHDKKRKDDLISALEKARQKAELTKLYLNRHNSTFEDMTELTQAIHSIDTALFHLGVVEPAL
ncbi:hypothetical protein [Paenibacillus eucommiae]|uniref:Uncharacterized protein n=1 Tax=Paenibacillus eucommiae TaxID=1355755 RepID=A0ABS4IY73_9BACL|nr:hypothetical protein [Paenibacillus eucommiae]MBP1992522.1 hypothetical protein [Paenibacillus eucommiae]